MWKTHQHTFSHGHTCCVHQTLLQCVAVCCSVLQCVAVCCSVLQCVATCVSIKLCLMWKTASRPKASRSLAHTLPRVNSDMYGVATISRLLKDLRLFCKKAILKRLYSEKETYNFKEPGDRSHPIWTRHVTLVADLCFRPTSWWFCVLQCVAVCCSMLQYVTVCCSLLQCVAVCCGTLHFYTRDVYFRRTSYWFSVL